MGCGDSGLDVANCYFYDPAVPFMQNVKTDSNGMQVRECACLTSRAPGPGMRMRIYIGSSPLVHIAPLSPGSR